MNDKVFLILIRFLSIATLATSIFASFFGHHTITINEHPWVSHLFDISCQELSGEARTYCETSYNTRHYTLWRSFGNFFTISDWDGGVLCGSSVATTSSNGTGTTAAIAIPTGIHVDLDALTVGNLGHCTKTMANIAVAFAVLTCLLTGFLTFYITVLAHENDTVLQVILASTTITSLSAMAVYVLEIDPLRLEPNTFCQTQTLFQHCEQSMGEGFWFQVATASMAFVALLLALVWRATATLQPSPQSTAHAHGHAAFYLTLHFWVQLVRFSELAILIVGVVSTFTIVKTSIPATSELQKPPAAGLLGHAFDGKGGQMQTEINLWQGLFCHPFGARLFLWSVVLNDHHETSNTTTPPTTEQETFGECVRKDLFECQMGMIMATVSAITAMTFQKDPKDMPLAYLIGFIMHFMSMVKLTWAMAAFMLEVYPGRADINPSYCERWTNYVPQPGGDCTIEVGVGMYLTGAALAAVAISFLGEVTIQRTADYGVTTAFWSLLGRARQGRFTDLIKPASERHLQVGTEDDDDDDKDDDNLDQVGIGKDYPKSVMDDSDNIGQPIKKDNGLEIKQGSVVVVEGDDIVNEEQPQVSMSVILVLVAVLILVVLAVLLVSLLVYEMSPHS